MPPIMGLWRSALFPAAGLKLASCFCRYSGIWLASFGLAGVGLLPSVPWQAAQIFLAMLCPLAASAPAAGSAAASGPGPTAELQNAPARFIPLFPPEPSPQKLVFYPKLF